MTVIATSATGSETSSPHAAARFTFPWAGPQTDASQRHAYLPSQWDTPAQPANGARVDNGSRCREDGVEDDSPGRGEAGHAGGETWPVRCYQRPERARLLRFPGGDRPPG